MEKSYHNPVLLNESIDGLAVREGGVYVDVTFGGGGHSKELLSRLGPSGRLFAFDQDSDSEENIFQDQRFTYIGQNFRFIKRFLRLHGVRELDGILGDFGVSSHQFDLAERGFSTRFDAALDMRMDQKSRLSARTVINEYEQKDLRKLLYAYGELKSAGRMAERIVTARKEEEIVTTEQLKEIVKPFLPVGKGAKVLAQLYQAIRIEVNQEIAALKEFLLQTEDLIKPGGRLSLISYHSLEDRLVKRFIRSGLFEGEPEKDMFGNIDVPFKKVGKLVVPSAEEVAVNNRARSAKLRIAERLGK